MPVISEGAVNTTAYGFSQQRLADLSQASEYTLVTLYVDASGSVAGFEKQIEAAIKNVVDSCSRSPRANNLLIRLCLFATDLTVVHDFRLLKEISHSDIDGCIRPSGMTCLRDAGVDMYRSISAGAKDLRDNDFEVNAIGFIITDGEDTCSKHGVNAVKAAGESLVLSEAVDSYRAVIIAINNSSAHFHTQLDTFATGCGFDQVIDAGNADANSLAKLAAFVSDSISSQSSSLGTGAASKPVTF